METVGSRIEAAEILCEIEKKDIALSLKDHARLEKERAVLEKKATIRKLRVRIWEDVGVAIFQQDYFTAQKLHEQWARLGLHAPP